MKQPKDVNGSSPLTDEGKKQLLEMFGHRYHVVSDGRGGDLSRWQRRRLRYGGRGQ